MIQPMETLLLVGAAFWVAGLVLLGYPEPAGGVAIGIGIVAVLRAFFEAGAA